MGSEKKNVIRQAECNPISFLAAQRMIRPQCEGWCKLGACSRDWTKKVLSVRGSTVAEPTTTALIFNALSSVQLPSSILVQVCVLPE